MRLLNLLVWLGVGEFCVQSQPITSNLTSTMMSVLSDNSVLQKCEFFSSTVSKDEKFGEECGQLQLTKSLQTLTTKEKIADELSTNFNSLLCLGAFTGIKSACNEDGNSFGRLENIPDKIEGFCGAQREYSSDCDDQHCMILDVLSVNVLSNETMCAKFCNKSQGVRSACRYLSSAVATLLGSRVPQEKIPTAGEIETQTELRSPSHNNSTVNSTKSNENTATSMEVDGSSKQTTSVVIQTATGVVKENIDAKVNLSEMKTEKSITAITSSSTPDLTPPPPIEQDNSDQNTLTDDVIKGVDEKEEEKSTEHKSALENNEDALFKGPAVEDTMEKGVFSNDESNFFSYFMLLSLVCILAYLVFHNKQKILALILEGRRRQGTRRKSGGRQYSKLNTDSNLEDTMNLSRESSMQQVIY